MCFIIISYLSFSICLTQGLKVNTAGIVMENEICRYLQNVTCSHKTLKLQGVYRDMAQLTRHKPIENKSTFQQEYWLFMGKRSSNLTSDVSF